MATSNLWGQPVGAAATPAVAKNPFNPNVTGPPTPTVNGTAAAASSSAAGLTQTGSNFLSTSASTLGPYLTRLKQIFSGDRAATLEAAAPEVATVSGQYDTAYKTAQTNMARGGGRNAVQADIPFQKANAIQETLQKEKSDAGKQLGDIGTKLATLGVDASVSGSQGFAQLLSTLVQQQGNSDQLIGSALGAAGEGIGSYLGFLALGL